MPSLASTAADLDAKKDSSPPLESAPKANGGQAESNPKLPVDEINPGPQSFQGSDGKKAIGVKQEEERETTPDGQNMGVKKETKTEQPLDTSLKLAQQPSHDATKHEELPEPTEISDSSQKTVKPQSDKPGTEFSELCVGLRPETQNESDAD